MRSCDAEKDNGTDAKYSVNEFGERGPQILIARRCRK